MIPTPLLAAGVLLLLTAAVGRGASISVTTSADGLADDGLCTLREAVIAANTNSGGGGTPGECPPGEDGNTDTIVLADGVTYSLTVAGASEDAAATGDLDVLDNTAAPDLIIVVAGGGTATISQDASPDDRVLDVLGGASVELASLTVTGGAGDQGGGVRVASGATLTISDSTVANNTASTSGGGIYNSGTLTVAASTVSANSAITRGAGISQNAGALTVTNSRLLGNTCPGNGDAVFNDVNAVNAISVTGSCIVGNGDTAVFNNQVASQNFTGNWWGSNDGPGPVGPGSGDTVSVNVDFSGFLTAPILGCPVVPVELQSFTIE